MKIEWQEIARRGKSHYLLFIDSVLELYRQGYFGRAHKTSWNPKHYRQFDNARWFGRQDMEKYQSLIEKATTQKQKIILKFAEEYRRRVNRFKNFADHEAKKDFSRLTNSQLLKIFQTWFEHTKMIWSFAYDYIFIDKFLPDWVTSAVSAKLSDASKLNETLGILFEVETASGFRKEKKALIKLTKIVKSRNLNLDSRIVKKQISKHLDRFAHLGFYYFTGAAYTKKDIRGRIAEYLNIPKSGFQKILNDFKQQDQNQY